MSCRALSVVLVSLGFALAGCGGVDNTQPQPQPQIDGAYESCNDQTDVCDSQTSCLPTTLPTGDYAGELCTVTCQVDNDCPSLVDNYDAICVESQCYTQCDGSGGCPYGTACFQFTDANSGDILQVCTP